MVRRIVLSVLVLGAGMAFGQALNGTYTIKPDGTGDFPSLVAAATALNSRGVGGDVVFNIYSGAYTEGTVNLTVNTGTRTVTWQAAPGQV